MKYVYVYVYVLDTLADWELGHVMPELNSGRYFQKPGTRISVKTVGATTQPITTNGGLTIVPDMVVEDIITESAAALLLPGADTWQQPQHSPVIEKAKQLLADGVLVGAICGATAGLAEAGVLDSRPHTSNALQYLTMTCPNYKGADHYQEQPVVTDANLITASAAGSLEFAREIITYLGVFSPQTLDAWYGYFHTAEARYFYDLMQSLPQK